MRQYIVTSNDEERPFSRDQRRWVYASSKREINTFGFGTDNEMEEIDSLVVFKHSPFPELPPAKGSPGAPPDYRLPAGKVLGAAHGRRGAFRPASLVNVSGMSYLPYHRSFARVESGGFQGNIPEGELRMLAHFAAFRQGRVPLVFSIVRPYPPKGESATVLDGCQL